MADIISLDISADVIPVDKIYTFSSGSFLCRFRKNNSGIFTVEFYNANGTVFLFANKLTYGQNVIDSILAPFTDKIIPLSINVLQGVSAPKEINDNTLGADVVLATAINE